MIRLAEEEGVFVELQKGKEIKLLPKEEEQLFEITVGRHGLEKIKQKVGKYFFVI